MLNLRFDWWDGVHVTLHVLLGPVTDTTQFVLVCYECEYHMPHNSLAYHCTQLRNTKR